MMSPDIEQQQDEYSDEMELVGYPQHHGISRRSARSIRNGNGTYQGVDEDIPLSSFDEDDNDGSYFSEDGEADGLISQLSPADHNSRVVGGSEAGSTNLDDYFMYGFSYNANGENSIDWRCAFWLGISFLLAACLAVILPGFNNFGKPIVQEDGTVVFPNGTTIERNQTSHAVSYTCPLPETLEDAQNYANSSVEESYNNRTAEIESNFSGFLDTFHEAEFDGWGKTYDFVKAGMYHWKSTRFPKNLKDGDTIYESASGIGLNLIMTLEILQEVKGVNNLIVYGNEYLEKSANTSNLILDALLPSLNATKGSVCTGDSTNLNFVPSDSFDLVFTGYIRYGLFSIICLVGYFEVFSLSNLIVSLCLAILFMQHAVRSLGFEKGGERGLPVLRNYLQRGDLAGQETGRGCAAATRRLVPNVDP